MAKLLVLYVFHILNYRVKHFLNNAIFADDNIDFIVIVNDKKIKINIPNNINNVTILYRDNIGYDFGGWSDALLTNNIYENYDNFIFVNSSVIGPYVQTHYKGKWTDIYIDGIQHNNVKLFGSTINTLRNPKNKSHVQSYIFSMDKNTLKYLIQCEIFSMTNYAKTFNDAIYQKEVLMSRKIIENNWNIGSLLQCYKDVDFTFANKTPEEYNITILDDVMFPRFKGVLWNDYDLVFIKGNRVDLSSGRRK